MSNLRWPVSRINHFLHVFAGTVTPDHSNELFDVVATGKVRIEVRQSYALADAAQAHRDLEARLTTGSTIFLP